MDGKRDIVVNVTPELLSIPLQTVIYKGNSEDDDTYCCIIPGEVIYKLFDK